MGKVTYEDRDKAIQTIKDFLKQIDDEKNVQNKKEIIKHINTFWSCKVGNIDKCYFSIMKGGIHFFYVLSFLVYKNHEFLIKRQYVPIDDIEIFLAEKTERIVLSDRDYVNQCTCDCDCDCEEMYPECKSCSCVQFPRIHQMQDHHPLTQITQDEFEQKVQRYFFDANNMNLKFNDR